MALVLVFFASAAALALEALLARYFALTQWHHLSFMVISVALLGFSASGVYVNLLATGRGGGGGRGLGGEPDRRLRAAGAGLAISSLVMFAVLLLLPLDFFRIASEPIQLAYLGLSYLACTVPFFFAGVVMAVAFAAGGHRPGAVYGASMGGSAVGVMVPIAVLPALGLRAAVLVPAVLVALPLLWPGQGPRQGTRARTRRAVRAAREGRAGREQRADGGGRAGSLGRADSAGHGGWRPAAAAVAAIAASIGLLAALPAVAPRPAPFKYLAQVLRFPDTRLEARRDTVRGRIDEVTGPTIRFAPGLSLGVAGGVPPQRAVVRDGDAALFLPAAEQASGNGAQGPDDGGAWLDAVHPAAVFHLGPPPRAALLLQEGGGLLLAAALRHSRRLLVAEPSGVVADRLRRLAGAAGPTASGPPAELRVVEEEPRAVARRMVRAGDAVDLVLIEDWGASFPGAQSHTQEPLLTVEAFADYLALVQPAGLVSVSRRLLLPPANAPRLAAVAVRALAAAGHPDPAAHVAMIRNWGSFTLLVGARPLTAQQLGGLRAFATRHGFDLVALPGLDPAETNRFNRLAEPFHAAAVAAVLGTGAFGRGQTDPVVDLRPATDDRPFFNRFVRWSRLPDYQRATGDRLYGLLLSGDVVAVAVLAEALVLVVVLLAIPVVRMRGGGSAGAAGTVGVGGGRLVIAGYNLALGLGFILIELMLIQRLTIAFGDPVVSLKVVLAALLVWSAAGGLLSERIRPRRAWLVALTIVGLCLVYAVAGTVALPWLLGLVRPARIAAVALVLAPLGTVLGMAFPLGMRLLAPTAATRSLAWAANGCASVIGAVASTLLAVAQGIAALGIVAAVGYAGAAVLALAAGRRAT